MKPVIIFTERDVLGLSLVRSFMVYHMLNSLKGCLGVLRTDVTIDNVTIGVGAVEKDGTGHG